jgi:4-amino-4-deoxy-L-arabinose transferase-like glycosyltransferase
LPRLTRGLVILCLTYFVLTLAVSILLPLRLAELHQTLISLRFSPARFMAGIASIPGAAPLGYFIQLPLAMLGHHTNLLLRLPSILAAVFNCYLIWRLARYTPIKSPLAAAVVFVCLPIQFVAATDSRPFELALLFLLLATNKFHEIMQEPDYRKIAIYCGLLTACIYTEPLAYLPAVGYVLFLPRFADKPAERRALWFILPATVIPVLLYAPYFAWANKLRNSQLLAVKLPFADADMWLQTLHSLAPGTLISIVGVVLFVLLAIGFGGGVFSSFPIFLWPRRTQINLFCLAGGTLTSIILSAALASAYRISLQPELILFAAPGLVILSFAALDWLTKNNTALRPLTYASAASLLAVLCVPALFEYVTTPAPDVGQLVRMTDQNITQNSCIVFVSERESPYFFLLYDPEIWKHECHNFFSKRIILASHPWVKPEQQRDAELFFRGLDFVEKKRVKVDSGLVIVDETP